MEEKEELLKITPKFNIIYELGMPTGRKIKNSIIAIIISFVIMIIGSISINYLNFKDEYQKNNIINTVNLVLIIIILFFVVKLIIHIIVQSMQYKNITYTFYNEYMEYKDTFWNHQTKIIRYENVKEIEERKNIWERINKCGIIILYTNAEKSKNKGMIIYSIKDVDNVYSKIQSIIDNVHKNSLIGKTDN